MTLMELGQRLKSEVESIGLKIFDEEVFHQPYRSDNYLFTIEACETRTMKQLRKQVRQLRSVLADLGIEQGMLTHQRWAVGRGKGWYAFYSGIKGSAIKKILVKQ